MGPYRASSFDRDLRLGLFGLGNSDIQRNAGRVGQHGHGHSTGHGHCPFTFPSMVHVLFALYISISSFRFL